MLNLLSFHARGFLLVGKKIIRRFMPRKFAKIANAHQIVSYEKERFKFLFENVQ